MERREVERRLFFPSSLAAFSCQSLQVQESLWHTLWPSSFALVLSTLVPTQPFFPIHLHSRHHSVCSGGFLMLSLGTALCVSRDGCQGNSGPAVCVNGQTEGVGGGKGGLDE